MKQCIKKIAEQPARIRSLIFDIRNGYIRNTGKVYKIELADIEKNWLDENGFEYTYRKDINEYEIKLD